MTDNIIPFKKFEGVTAKEALESSLNTGLDDVIVLGWKDDILYYAASKMSSADANWMLDSTKAMLLNRCSFPSED
ncbi:MAG: hypothetical protein OEX12_00050 [Gammaproteobacteria bacterium]|nr:hypothetical protein [Gammaproteobacteria bacterium]